MEFYYKVLVGSPHYHGNEALTYSSGTALPLFSVVRIPLQKYTALGIITEKVPKPDFATKPLAETFDLPPMPAALITMVLWLRRYYPAPLGLTTAAILPGQLSQKAIAEIAAEPPTALPAVAAALPALTTDQKNVLGRITKPDTYILHGDTGTGKTRVYIELARRAIENNKNVLVLTPEISLTSQLANNFKNVFGNRVVIMHSGLTPKAREKVWLKIISQNPLPSENSDKKINPLIILGPRSALFAPVNYIGLIVVDEFHEPAYKQEQAPHYQAVRVAARLADLHKAPLILGSATPTITDYFIAERLHKPILRMTALAAQNNKNNDNPDSRVTKTLIDLKNRELFSRSQYLSDALIKSITTSLNNNEQSLLYLNRRGTARVILCNNCGWQAHCPHCDLPLTYHHDLYQLQCHTCGYHQAVPTSCPECGNTEIIFKVVGTKAIEEEVRRLFPNARIMRFDTDNKKAERFEQHYDTIIAGEVDILIGTQLLAKGLDLPKLTTLGVVIADTSLTFPDYSAEERTYQLLNQVIGRVGRGHSAEERIFVQSYDPSRPVITAALKGDWPAMYSSVLEERKLFTFPPFCYALKLSCRRATSTAAEKASEQYLYSIKQLHLPLLIDGPTPSFHARIAGKYEWQLIVKSKRREVLLQVIAALPKSGWTYDIDPTNLL